MDTRPFSHDRLRKSPVAAPPLARKSDLSLSWLENRRLIRYVENAGISTLLYGSNANLENTSVLDYGEFLEILVESVGNDTLAVPAIGPEFGTMMAQVHSLRSFPFPTALVLSGARLSTPEGTATGIRRVAETFGKPVVLEIGDGTSMPADLVAGLVEDGVVCWIVYSVGRPFPADDRQLEALTGSVEPALISSGAGESAAVAHMQRFGLSGFVSGIASLAPMTALALWKAITSDAVDRAHELQEHFRTLEALRLRHGSVRVLHEAVRACGIADVGPLLPFLSDLAPELRKKVAAAAEAMLAIERSAQHQLS